MAIKIRCSECDKKIVIDNAFAGGACRCPFCSAIVMVPGGPEAAAGPRPGAPDARPSEPGAAPSAAQVPSHIDPSTVPMAKADRTMTFLAAGAVAMLLLIVVLGIIMVVISSKSKTPPVVTNEAAPAENAPAVDPFKTVIKGPAIAGNISLATPVVYVIDGGDAMVDVFDKAVVVTRVSIRTLGAGDKFSVLVSTGTDAGGTDAPAAPAAEIPAVSTTTSAPASKPASGPKDTPIVRTTGRDLVLNEGAKNEASFDQWIRGYQERQEVPSGRSDILATLDVALRMKPKPKTIVLFTLKDLTVAGGNLDPRAAAVAAQAKAQGTAIICIGLPPGSSGIDLSVQAGLAKFAQACGAKAVNYDFDAFETYSTEFEKLNEKGTN